MRRVLYATVRLVLVVLLIAALPARAVFGQIGVSFEPSSGSWVAGTQIGVTIKFCANPEHSYVSHWITFNGQDVSGSFSQTSGWDGSCVFQQYWTGNVTLATGTNTLAAGFTAYYFDGADVYYETPFSNTAYYTGTAPPVDAPSLEDYGRCAMSCFAATYAQSTVPYYSLDTPRNLTLVYNGDRVDPKPFVHVDFTVSGSVPSYLQLRVRKADGSYITFLNGESALRFQAATGTWRLGGQFNAASNGMSSTGAYLVDVIVGQMFGSLQETVVATRRLIVVNEANSPIARGWTLAGVQRLYPIGGGGALITEGDGSAVYFAWNGTQFVAPAGEFSRLTSGGGAYERVYPDSTRVWFSPTGLMSTVTDRWGNQTTVLHDGSSRVWKIRDPSHTSQVPREIVLTYDANGLDYVQDPFSRVTQVTVQTNRTLTAIRDPDNDSTRFGHDGSLRLSTITNRAGTTVATLGYHTSGKITSVTGPWIAQFGGWSSQPSTVLAPWHHVGVPYGSTSTPVAPARSDTVRAYVTDPQGHVTWMTVNGFGQPTRTAAPLGDTVTVTYNAAGQPTQIADRLGGTSSFTYDAAGFMTSSTVGGVATYARNGGWGQADSIWGASGSAIPTRRMFLNTTNGRVESSQVAGSPYRSYFYYDSRGRVERVTDPNGHLTFRRWFNGTNGNASRDSVPGNRATTYGYDTYGRLTTVSAPGMPTRTTHYSIANRPDSVFDGVNATPTRFWHGRMWLDSIADPAGNRHRFGYNGLGWLVTRTDALGRNDSLQYDADGLVRQSKNRRGQVVQQTYDDLHRRRIRSGTNLAPDTVSYATDGTTVTASNANATETATLNLTRGVVSQVQTVVRLPGGGTQTFTRSYAYRTADNLLDTAGVSGASLTFLGRGYVYRTGRGTVDSMRLGAAWTAPRWDNDLMPTTIRFPGGYDSIMRGLLATHDAAVVSSRVISDTLHRDSLGRLDFIHTDDLRQRAVTYDGLGRIKTVQHRTATSGGCTYYLDYGFLCGATLDSTQTYTYSATGNIESISSANGTTAGYYGTGNRITGFGPSGGNCSYSTDYDGNVTQRACSGDTINFYWAADGRLDSLKRNGVRIAYGYDASGRLVRRDSAGSVRSHFLWDGEHLLAELGPSANSLVAQYAYNGLDDLHAVIISGTPAYAHTDAMGNIRGYTSNGTQYGSYRYDEWGRPVSGGAGAFGILERPHWKGALWMEPGPDLYYMRNRWYEPRTGRFLTEDPIGLAGGVNAYTFGAGDPIDNADPDGLQCRVFNALGTGHPHGSGLHAHGPCDQYRTISAAEAWMLLQRECIVDPYAGGCDGFDYQHQIDPLPDRTEPPPQLAPDAGGCGAAWLSFAGTALLDAAFLTGVGAAARLGKGAVLLRGTAFNIARQNGWRTLGRLAYQGSLVAGGAASARRVAQVTGLTGAITSGAYAGSVQMLTGGVDQSFLLRLADFIPGVASLKGLGTAIVCEFRN